MFRKVFRLENLSFYWEIRKFIVLLGFLDGSSKSNNIVEVEVLEKGDK